MDIISSYVLQVEPYLTTLALFDAKEGRKLTEDFHLDVNHSVVVGLIADPEGVSENILGDMISSPLRPKQVSILLFTRDHITYCSVIT